MTKKNFYSMHRIDGEFKAIRHEGYTDGTYNYYNNGRAAWSAIHPATGIAVAFAGTRKECVQLAYSEKAQRALDHFEKSGCLERWSKDFNEHVNKVRKENLYGGIAQ